MGVVEIDVISVWGIGYDLISREGVIFYLVLCGDPKRLGLNSGSEYLVFVSVGMQN